MFFRRMAQMAAEGALLSYGSGAGSPLLEAADRLKSVNDISKSELRKCRSILLLLGDVTLKPADADRLRCFTTNLDRQVSLLACRAVWRSGSQNARSAARAKLQDLRSSASWLERLQIDKCLSSTGDESRS